MKILVVDDNEAFRETLTDPLVAMGNSVDGVSTGMDALLYLEREDYDVAFIDIKLPDISGIKVLEAVQAKQHQSTCIMITGNYTIENAKQAINQGAQAYLTKPLDYKELVKMMETLQSNVAKGAGRERLASIIGTIRVLIVDDDMDFCTTVKDILELNKYSVESAASGEEAVLRMENEAFDVALIDVNMPDMTGIELLEVLKSGRSPPSCIMVTGQQMIEYAVEALNLGAEAFILKPFDAERLISCIDRVTKMRRLEQELERQRQMLEDLYENAPIMYLSLDAESRIIKVNDTMCRSLGYSKDEVIGRPMTFLLSEEGAVPFTESYPGLLESSGQVSCERQLSTSDGGLLDVVGDIAVERDEMGEFLYTRTVFRDVSDRKRAEAEVRRLSYRFNDVQPGGCYLSESHERCLKAYADLAMHGVPGLCIIREAPGPLAEEYGLNAGEIMLLSSRPLGGFRALADLQEVSRAFSESLEAGVGVVLLDGLEYLVSRFGFDPVYSFIQEKRFDFLEAGAVLLMPFDPRTLSEREKALLASETSALQ